MNYNQNNGFDYSYRPLGAWTYWVLRIVFLIPIVGFIIALVLAFSAENINLRNYARSFFCTFAVAFIFIFIFLVVGGGLSALTFFLTQ